MPGSSSWLATQAPALFIAPAKGPSGDFTLTSSRVPPAASTLTTESTATPVPRTFVVTFTGAADGESDADGLPDALASLDESAAGAPELPVQADNDTVVNAAMLNAVTMWRTDMFGSPREGWLGKG
ncbi:hypothetical protein NOCA2100057 [metagenome]|uniref:Uncharacterized protein n=1 Tax=metagenome TaxID=256318 RepID=A0A2P2BW05_9ZZZZ